MQFAASSVEKAGVRRFIAKIAEDGNTLPQDRAFFLYNHFQDAIRDATLTPPSALELSLDRYTLGFEKVFLDTWSVELRLPLLGGYDGSENGLQLDTGTVGDLA